MMKWLHANSLTCWLLILCMAAYGCGEQVEMQPFRKDVRYKVEMAAVLQHGREVATAAFSPDGTRIVTASFDETARVWDATDGKELLVLRGHAGSGHYFDRGYVRSAAFSPDGKRIVTASDDKTARIWDAATGKQLAVLRGHTDIVWSAAFSPDGKRIATRSVFASYIKEPDRDLTVRLWDAATGAELVGGGLQHDRPIHFAPLASTLRHGKSFAASEIRSVAFSPDSKTIVTTSDNFARTWDVATGKELVVLRGHADYVTSAKFSSDGKRIVTASSDKTARVWDAASGKQLAIIYGPDGSRGSSVSGGIEFAAFSPDGKRVATVSEWTTVRLWDAASGQELMALRGHGGINVVTFSPDGTRLVAGANDHIARLWDIASGRELAVLRGHEDVIWDAKFSTDGTRIITASYDKTARVWDIVEEADRAEEGAEMRGEVDRQQLERHILEKPDWTGPLSPRLKVKAEAGSWDKLVAQVKPTLTWGWPSPNGDIPPYESPFPNMIWIDQNAAGKPVFRLEQAYVWQPAPSAPGSAGGADGVDAGTKSHPPAEPGANGQMEARWVLVELLPNDNGKADKLLGEQIAGRRLPIRVEVTDAVPDLHDHSLASYAIVRSVDPRGGTVYEVGWKMETSHWLYRYVIYFWRDTKGERGGWRVLGDGPSDHITSDESRVYNREQVSVQWQGNPVKPTISIVKAERHLKRGDMRVRGPDLVVYSDVTLDGTNETLPTRPKWSDKQYMRAQKGDTLNKMVDRLTTWNESGLVGEHSLQLKEKRGEVAEPSPELLRQRELRREISREKLRRLNPQLPVNANATLKEGTQVFID